MLVSRMHASRPSGWGRTVMRVVVAAMRTLLAFILPESAKRAPYRRLADHARANVRHAAQAGHRHAVVDDRLLGMAGDHEQAARPGNSTSWPPRNQQAVSRRRLPDVTEERNGPSL